MESKTDWISEMIERQSIPLVLREGTVEDFCNKHNISPSNYYYHLYKQDNQEKIIDITLSKAKTAVPEILEKLIEKAKEGDMKAIDIYLDSVAKLAKNLDIKSGGKPISILSNVFSNNSDNKDNKPQEED